VAAVFLDIEKARDITWNPGLLYNVPKLKVSISKIKIIGSFLSKGKFKVLFEGIIPMQWEIQAGVLQGSALFLILHIFIQIMHPEHPMPI
jgi:hypothetical protein